jgi:hypothetical protein
LKKTILFFFALTLLTTSFAQVDSSLTVHSGITRKLKALAYQQIHNLREGALIVRLKSNTTTIEKLREKGYDEAANEMIQRIKIENQALVRQINNHFDFCPVYFIYSHDAKHIKNKEFDKVTFLSSDLKPDSTILFTHKTFLTAAYGTISANRETKVYSHTKDYPEETNTYQGISDLQVTVFYIMDEEFRRVMDPFPGSAGVFNSYKNAVKRMNTKLYQFLAFAPGQNTVIQKRLKKKAARKEH